MPEFWRGLQSTLMNKLFSSIVIGVLLVLLLQGFCTQRSQQKEIQALKEDVTLQIDEVRELTGQFPDYTDAFTKFNGQYLVLADRFDSLSAQMDRIYIPAEGSYQITTVIDSTKLVAYNEAIEALLTLDANVSDATRDSLQQEILSLLYATVNQEIDVQYRGFTLAPEAGISYNSSGDFEVTLGSRIAYWNHWGLGVEGSIGIDDTHDLSLGLYGDYRDIWGLRNLGIGIGVQRKFAPRETNFNLGVHNYF